MEKLRLALLDEEKLPHVLPTDEPARTRCQELTAALAAELDHVHAHAESMTLAMAMFNAFSVSSMLAANDNPTLESMLKLIEALDALRVQLARHLPHAVDA